MVMNEAFCVGQNRIGSIWFGATYVKFQASKWLYRGFVDDFDVNVDKNCLIIKTSIKDIYLRHLLTIYFKLCIRCPIDQPTGRSGFALQVM